MTEWEKHTGTMPEIKIISYWRQQDTRDLSNRLPMAIRCNRYNQPNLLETIFIYNKMKTVPGKVTDWNC